MTCRAILPPTPGVQGVLEEYAELFREACRRSRSTAAV